MKKVILLFLAIASTACDAGKGTVAPVKATITRQQVDVPFDYRDCAAPSTISFTVVASKKTQSFTVRVLDAVSGTEYTLDPYRPLSDTYAFPPLPAAGHLYFVELLNGSNGKITANVYAR